MNTRHPVEPSTERHGKNETNPAVGSPPEHAQPVATITISHFRGDPGMENFDLDYYGALPVGSHTLYAAPPEHADLLGELRADFLKLARMAEALKRPCGMDPESAQAIRNSQYMNLSYFARAALARIDTVLNREPQQ